MTEMHSRIQREREQSPELTSLLNTKWLAIPWKAGMAAWSLKQWLILGL